MKGIALLALALPLLAEPAHRVSGPGLELEFDGRGVVTGLRYGNPALRRAVSLRQVLEGFSESAAPKVREEKGALIVERVLENRARGLRCRMTERWEAVPNLRWTVAVAADGRPFSAALQTRLVWPNPNEAKLWTAWTDTAGPRHSGWADPLMPAAFSTRHLSYGGKTMSDGQPYVNDASAEYFRDVFSLPLITVLEEKQDTALTIAWSPEDTWLDACLDIDAKGSAAFSRLHHRFGEGRTRTFRMELAAHAADWRAALGWMVRRWPEFFEPNNALADEVAGLGAYSSHEGPIDVAKMKRIGFTVNWKASYDFPYMGLFFPPAKEWIPYAIDERGRLFTNRLTERGMMSAERLERYAQGMRAIGFHVFSYFNATEFGADIEYPAPPRKASDAASRWKDANDYLYANFPGAILKGPNGRPYWTWGDAVAVDPGDGAYQAFLLEMARQYFTRVPSAAGLCIDRTDWTRVYNRNADDGVTWYNDAPARSGFISWNRLLEKLGPMAHAANKVIFLNQHVKRLDAARQADGFYDELAWVPYSLNGTALLGLRRPVIGWTFSDEDLKPQPDHYFQKFLHLGAFPTAPFPGNDHTIAPSAFADEWFLRYGPMFRALHARKWVLSPHALSVEDDTAKGNLFETPAGTVAAITFGGDSARVRVQAAATGQAKACEVLHPGSEEWKPLDCGRTGAEWTASVPLLRGCALVRFR